MLSNNLFCSSPPRGDHVPPAARATRALRASPLPRRARRLLLRLRVQWRQVPQRQVHHRRRPVLLRLRVPRRKLPQWQVHHRWWRVLLGFRVRRWQVPQWQMHHRRWPVLLRLRVPGRELPQQQVHYRRRRVLLGFRVRWWQVPQWQMHHRRWPVLLRLRMPRRKLPRWQVHHALTLPQAEEAAASVAPEAPAGGATSSTPKQHLRAGCVRLPSLWRLALGAGVLDGQRWGRAIRCRAPELKAACAGGRVSDCRWRDEPGSPREGLRRPRSPPSALR